MTILRRTLTGIVLGSLLACGDPFSPPACYSGPGCGEDDVPPEGKILGPVYGTTVYGPFWLRIEASDNIGVLGVHYQLMGFDVDKRLDASPPYEFLVNPAAADGLGSTPGPRYLQVFVRDVADNVDTLDWMVNYQY
jgi:hypothetical protein